MKLNKYIIPLCLSFVFYSCNNEDAAALNEPEEQEEHDHHEENEVHFSLQQFEALEMRVDSLPMRNMASYIIANGQLEVPPQNEATVTAIIGANVQKILVIEGDKVDKGQVLAYITHPDLINLQTDYINTYSQLEFLEKDFNRQKKLYDEKVGSGKDFQKIQADYLSTKAKVKGYEAQFKLLGVNTDVIRKGNIYEAFPILSPINGHVKMVEVKTAQYVQAQTEMFEIVNIDHIHADFMVFEKDVHKVKEGQKILFSLESIPNKELEATIYSVGKSFEQDPKAIHLHADIINKEGIMLPGMYVRGRILSESVFKNALPENAIVQEGGKYFIFTAQKEDSSDSVEWHFEAVEVAIGAKDNNWIEIKLFKDLPAHSKVAWNNAYYLMAELKKGEAEHNH